MKKLSLFLIPLSLLFFACNSSDSESQESEESTEEEVEFADGETMEKDAILEACIEEASGLYGDVLDGASYCDCALATLSEEFGAEELASLGMEMQGGNSVGAFEEMLSQLGPESTTAIVGCLSNSLSDPEAKLSDLSPELYQYTIDGCVAEINNQGGLGEIDADEYCTCFFDKIKDEMTYAELLSASENPDVIPMDVVFECMGMDME